MTAASAVLEALSIAPVAEDDLAEVSRLAHVIWPAAYAGILTPEQITNMLEKIYSLDNLRKEIVAGHRFWMAYDRGSPAGYVSSYREGDSVWIKKIYVDPTQQGQGIGERLMNTAMEPWLPARDVRLLVNARNISAQHFYERRGFIKEGTLPVRMGDWDFEDILYVKPL